MLFCSWHLACTSGSLCCAVFDAVSDQADLQQADIQQLNGALTRTRRYKWMQMEYQEPHQTLSSTSRGHLSAVRDSVNQMPSYLPPKRWCMRKLKVSSASLWKPFTHTLCTHTCSDICDASAQMFQCRIVHVAHGP